MENLENETIYDYSKYPITDIYFTDAYSKDFICEPSLKRKVGFIIDSYYTSDSDNPTFLLWVLDENNIGGPGELVITDNLVCRKNMTDLDLIYYNSNLQSIYKKALQLDSYIKNNPGVDIRALKEELLNYALSKQTEKYSDSDLESKKRYINRRLIDLFQIYEKISSPENVKERKDKTRSLSNEIINNN